MFDLTPGFTAIPNDFLDQTAPTLTAAELRVTLYIYRHTIGYQKLSDAISYSQFTDGITSQDGRKIDCGAGVSRRSLPVALAGLERRGLISRSGGSSGGAVRYSIVQPGVQPRAKAIKKSPEPKAGSGLGPEQPVAALLTTPRPGQNSQVPTPALQAEPEVSPQEPQIEVGQISPAPAPQVGQKLQETALQLGQLLPPTKESESNIKPDRAAVALILDRVSGITTRQTEKLVCTAMRNQRDISYVRRLVGYVTSVAGNPAAMLTTLIKTNQDRTTGANQPVQEAGALRYMHRQTSHTNSALPRRPQPPIDFSKPFYQHLIAQQNSSIAPTSLLEGIE